MPINFGIKPILGVRLAGFSEQPVWGSRARSVRAMRAVDVLNMMRLRGGSGLGEGAAVGQAPASLGGNGKAGQNCAEDHVAVMAMGLAQGSQQGSDRGDAEQRADDVANAAGDADTAEHYAGYGSQFQGLLGAGPSRAEAQHQRRATQAGNQASHRVQ